MICSYVSSHCLTSIAKNIFNQNILLVKNPVPVRCPVAGKFNFTQRGEHPFKTRYIPLTKHSLELNNSR